MAIVKINDRLLSNEGRYHQNLPDVPNKSADEMKEFMDYIPRNVIIPKLNEVIQAVNELEEQVKSLF